MSTFPPAPAGHGSTPLPQAVVYMGTPTIFDPADANTTWDINDPALPANLKAAVAAWQASETPES